LIGVFTGYWLRSGKPKYELVSGLFFAGITGLFLGIVLDYGFPINKALWSPSYVIFTGGMALVFLAMCYYLIDIKSLTGWSKPFVIFGTNAIALYVLSEAMSVLLIWIKLPGQGTSVKGWLYTSIFAPLFGELNGSLAFALGYVLLWLGLMAILYRKRIFIKV